MELLYKILLGLDAIVYNFINWLFQIFLILTRVNILSEETITPFVKRVYTIVGTVMLFVLAYSMLRGIVNPETKGKDTAGKTIMAVVKAVVLLALVPTLFDFAYEIQDSILKQNTIGKLILGNNSTWKDVQKINGIDDSKLSQSLTNAIDKGGITMASTVLDAFIISKTGEDVSVDGNSNITLSGIKDTIQTNEEFDIITELAPEIAKDDSQIKYIWLVSTGCGVYIAILLLGYCLALGLRVVKLAFYELIAPLPIMMSILPSHKDSLSKWFGEVSKTFLDVFIRIGVLYIVVYLITLVRTSLDGGVEVFGSGVSGFNKFMAGAIIVMGIITFAKKAPEHLSAATGLKTEGIGMGWNAVKEQLKSGGLFTGGAIAGGAITAAVRNGGRKLRKAHNQMKEANDLTDKKERNKARAKAVAAGMAGIGSGIVSLGTGAVRAGKSGKEASSWADIKNAAHEGADKVVKNSTGREDKKGRYKAEANGKKFAGIRGRWGDFVDSTTDWATGGAQQYDAAMNEAKDMQSNAKNTLDAAKKFITKYGNNKTMAKMFERIIDDKGNIVGYKDINFKGTEEEKQKLASALDKFMSQNMSIEDIREAITKERNLDVAANVSKLSFVKSDDYVRAQREAIAKVNREDYKLADGKYDETQYQAALDIAKDSVNVNDYIDMEKYEKAIEKATAEKSKKIQVYSKVLSQLEDQTAIEIVNAIGDGTKKNTKILIDEFGISEANLAKTGDIENASKIALQAFQRAGGTVTQTVDVYDAKGVKIGEEKKTINQASFENAYGKAIDDMKKAYEDIERLNSAKAAEIKSKQSTRKNENK